MSGAGITASTRLRCHTKIRLWHLDRFIDEQKRNFVSYAQEARMYSMNYYSFVKLAKELLVKMYRR